jgi:hypothetical protein
VQGIDLVILFQSLAIYMHTLVSHHARLRIVQQGYAGMVMGAE